jgi:hypothetical protein
MDSGDPITQTSERTSKSTNKSFTTRNETDPSSMSMERIPSLEKAAPSIVVTEAGIEKRSNESQQENTSCLIVVSFDGGSQIADARDRHQ